MICPDWFLYNRKLRHERVKLANNINYKTRNPPLNENTSRTKEPVETKYRYPTLETVNAPTDKGNLRSDSLNKQVTAKENSMNTTNQKIPSSDDKSDCKPPDKKKLTVFVLLGYSMVKDMKGWKIFSCTCKVVVKVIVVHKKRT